MKLIADINLYSFERHQLIPPLHMIIYTNHGSIVCYPIMPCDHLPSQQVMHI